MSPVPIQLPSEWWWADEQVMVEHRGMNMGKLFVYENEVIRAVLGWTGLDNVWHVGVITPQREHTDRAVRALARSPWGPMALSINYQPTTREGPMTDYPDTKTVTPGSQAETAARLAHDQIVDQLQVKRAQRGKLNEEIKQLVAEQDTLGQVIRAFDRAAKTRKENPNGTAQGSKDPPG